MMTFVDSGILLNPVCVVFANAMPVVLASELYSQTANTDAIADELGVIAGALCEFGHAHEGDSLLDTLRSGVGLREGYREISSCLAPATPKVVLRAIERSGRFFGNREDIIDEVLRVMRSFDSGRVRSQSIDGAFADMIIFAAIDIFGGCNEAAMRLGLSRETVDRRVALSPYGSELANIKGGKRGKPRGPLWNMSDYDLARAIVEHGTVTAAGQALGVSHSSMYRRLSESSGSARDWIDRNLKRLDHGRRFAIRDDVVVVVPASERFDRSFW